MWSVKELRELQRVLGNWELWLNLLIIHLPCRREHKSIIKVTFLSQFTALEFWFFIIHRCSKRLQDIFGLQIFCFLRNGWTENLKCMLYYSMTFLYIVRSSSLFSSLWSLAEDIGKPRSIHELTWHTVTVLRFSFPHRKLR